MTAASVAFGSNRHQWLFGKVGEERQSPLQEESALALQKLVNEVQNRVISKGEEELRPKAKWQSDLLNLAVWRRMDQLPQALSVNDEVPFRGFLSQYTASMSPREAKVGMLFLITGSALVTVVILVMGVAALLLFPPAWSGPIALFLVMGAVSPALLLVTLTIANGAHVRWRELHACQEKTKEWDASLEKIEQLLTKQAGASPDLKQEEKRGLLVFTREMMSQLTLFTSEKESEKKDLRVISALWKGRVEWLVSRVEKLADRELFKDFSRETLSKLHLCLQICELWLLKSLSVVDGADEEGAAEATEAAPLEQSGEQMVQGGSG